MLTITLYPWNLQRITHACYLGGEMFPFIHIILLDLSHTNESSQDFSAVTIRQVSSVQKDDIAAHKNLNVFIQLPKRSFYNFCVPSIFYIIPFYAVCVQKCAHITIGCSNKYFLYHM